MTFDLYEAGAAGNAAGIYGTNDYVFIGTDPAGILNAQAIAPALPVQDNIALTGRVSGIFRDPISTRYLHIAFPLNTVLEAVRFVDRAFARISSFDTGFNSNGIWADDQYIYVANDAGGVAVFTFQNRLYNFVTRAQPNFPVAEQCQAVYGDGTYIYAANGALGIQAFTFDGAALTLLATDATLTIATSIWSDGTYVYAGDVGTGLYAFTFDGAVFTQVGHWNPNVAPNSVIYNKIWGDPPYIYTVSEVLVGAPIEGFHILTFNGNQFTVVENFTPNLSCYDVHSKDNLVFVGGFNQTFVYQASPEFDGTFSATPTRGPVPLEVRFTDNVRIF